MGIKIVIFERSLCSPSIVKFLLRRFATYFSKVVSENVEAVVCYQWALQRLLVPWLFLLIFLSSLNSSLKHLLRLMYLPERRTCCAFSLVWETGDGTSRCSKKCMAGVHFRICVLYRWLESLLSKATAVTIQKASTNGQL